MSERHRDQEHEQLRREAEGMTGGPGVVATKSQARGSLAGVVGGGILGFLLGMIIGAIFFSGGRNMWITAIVLTVAGLVVGGVAGGIAGPRRKLRGSEADT